MIHNGPKRTISISGGHNILEKCTLSKKTIAINLGVSLEKC